MSTHHLKKKNEDEFMVADITQVNHFRRLEKMYHGHPLNQFFEAKLKISNKITDLDIPIKNIFHHAAGAVHGSVYFKALDDAAYFAANSVVFDVFLLTVSFTTYFTKPVSSGILKTIGKLVNSTRSQFISEAVLYNSNNEEIARGNGIYVRSKMKLDKCSGYS